MLATIPPIVARFCEEGSGPKRRPWAAAAAWRVEPTHPGSTVAVRASGSMCRTRFMWREKSRTRPGPIAFDAHEVPPPRAVRGTLRAREGDGERRDARQAGVGGVARACPHPVVDVDECAQFLQEAVAHGPSVSRARGPGRGYPLCGWLIGARVRSEGDGADRGRAARL